MQNIGPIRAVFTRGADQGLRLRLINTSEQELTGVDITSVWLLTKEWHRDGDRRIDFEAPPRIPPNSAAEVTHKTLIGQEPIGSELSRLTDAPSNQEYNIHLDFLADGQPADQELQLGKGSRVELTPL